jgi:hypothetical protein
MDRLQLAMSPLQTRATALGAAPAALRTVPLQRKSSFKFFTRMNRESPNVCARETSRIVTGASLQLPLRVLLER